jgi:hypothetical protein
MVFLAIYDLRVFGSPFRLPGETVEFGSPLDGTVGLLVSPSRGLLVYTPFVIVSLAALIASWRWRDGDLIWLLRFGSLATAASLLFFGWYADWIGGWSYGNRYLNDLLPLYMLATAVAWPRWLTRPWPRRAFAVAVGWGVLISSAGAGLYYYLWNGTHWDVTPDIAATPWRVWSWTDAQWQWVVARLILDPPATIAIEALVLGGSTVAYVLAARRFA